jgi:tetratricopeptide (TPR) repeat protein
VIARAALVLVALVATAAPARAESLSVLEEKSKAFYRLLDRGERERAAAEWPSLEKALSSTADGLQAQLDRMQDEITEADGDLDALYKSPRWRDTQIASLVVTYHLAWVRYQGAQLVGDKARRQQLLKQAAEGFSQFLILNEVPEIYAESLYGRGLAYLDLGDVAKASEDLEAAAKDPRTAAKAKVALAELRRRGGGGGPDAKAPAPDDPEVLVARLGDLIGRAAAGDAGAEKEASALARGLAARGGTWPARVQSVVVDKLGGGSPEGVHSSWGLLLLAQLAVDRNRCGDVAALTSASAAVNDAGHARNRPELLYLDAACRLNAGQQRAAADAFAALLKEYPDAPRAREAAYYRFRALDVARASDRALDPEFAQSLDLYLSRWGKAEGAGEAHFLRAELARQRGDCTAAATEYAQVTSGPYAARARLGALECRAAGVAKASPEARRALLDDLRAYVRSTPAKGDDAPQVARAALMGALVAAASTPPDHAAVVELTGGFEQRYPDAKSLYPRVREARLRARIGLGQVNEARADLEAYLAEPDPDGERRKTLATIGRELATQAERAGPEQGAAAATAAREVYRALLRDGGGPGDRIVLADLELRAGDAKAARALYEQALAAEPSSAEALRGAARAAAVAGDGAAALDYWKRVVEGSTTGGTAWYEARLAQVTLLAGEGHRSEACEVIRLSRGHATSAGADALDGRLRQLEPEVCR